MTQQEIVALVFGMLSGKPFSPKEGITITAPPTMDFQVRREGERIIVTWKSPYILVTASIMGWNANGNLTGIIIEKDRYKPIVGGLIPDFWYDFT